MATKTLLTVQEYAALDEPPSVRRQLSNAPALCLLLFSQPVMRRNLRMDPH